MSQDYQLEIDVNEVNSIMQSGEDFILIDVREPAEYQTASIGGAVLIPLGELRTSLQQLEPYRSKRIVIHCHHGGRSLRAAMGLRQLGFSGAKVWQGELMTGV